MSCPYNDKNPKTNTIKEEKVIVINTYFKVFLSLIKLKGTRI